MVVILIDGNVTASQFVWRGKKYEGIATTEKEIT